MAEHHVGRRQVAVDDVREVHLGDLLSDHDHQRIWHPTRRRSACTASGIEILGGDVPCEMVYSSRRSGATSAGASPSSSPSSSSPSASASPSAPPPSKNLTLLPSIHSIPSKPLTASTIRIPGTFTPDLHHPRFGSRDQQRGGRRRPRRGGGGGGDAPQALEQRPRFPGDARARERAVERRVAVLLVEPVLQQHGHGHGASVICGARVEARLVYFLRGGVRIGRGDGETGWDLYVLLLRPAR